MLTHPTLTVKRAQIPCTPKIGRRYLAMRFIQMSSLFKSLYMMDITVCVTDTESLSTRRFFTSLTASGQIVSFALM